MRLLNFILSLLIFSTIVFVSIYTIYAISEPKVYTNVLIPKIGGWVLGYIIVFSAIYGAVFFYDWFKSHIK